MGDGGDRALQGGNVRARLELSDRRLRLRGGVQHEDRRRVGDHLDACASREPVGHLGAGNPDANRVALREAGIAQTVSEERVVH